MKKSTGVALASIVIAFAAVVAGLVTIWSLRPPQFNGTFLDPGMPMPDFQLTSSDGVVAKSDFAGHITVLVFGYTYCPDVCPTNVARLSQSLRILEKRREEVRVVMITVDPARDTPETLARYLTAFDTTFVGLSGSESEIQRVTEAYGVFYEREDTTSAGGYLVNHTASITVLDRVGDARLLWPFGTGPEEMAADLRRLMRLS